MSLSTAPAAWPPAGAAAVHALPKPLVLPAMLRGICGRCPACGQGHAFAGYLKVVSTCRACGAPLGNARADDAPPYFTLFIAGHLVIPPIVVWERSGSPPTWLLMALFLPLTAALTLGLLRPVKGATLGLLLAFELMKQPGAPGDASGF
ncbi:MAG: DUF983 domain-containing protein [Acetobacteraceae bacterium]